MASVIFDTLQYAKKAKDVGFTEKQAEFQAEAIAEIINDQLVTKQDLATGLKYLEYRLIIKLGVMLTAAIGIVAAIIKL